MADYSLKKPNRFTVGEFNPAIFQGTVAQFPTQDYSGLQNAFNIIENRVTKLAEQRGAIAAAINKLPINAAEDAWKANYINNIQKQIDESAQEGDYAGALQTATRLANEAVFSPEVIGRVRANQQFEEDKKRQLDRLQRGDIKQDTYNWWLKNNKYSYKDIRDDKGNIIGGSEYTSSMPVKDLDPIKHALLAKSIIMPTRVNRTTGTTTSHEAFKQERITEDSIKKNIDKILERSEDGYAAIEQRYYAMLNELKDKEAQYNEIIANNPDSQEARNLKQEIARRSKLLKKNGVDVDPDTFYARYLMDTDIIKSLAYDYKETSNIKGTGTSGNLIDELGPDDYEDDSESEEGPALEREGDTANSFVKQLEAVATAIKGLF